MQIIWITNYFFLLLVGVHKLSDTSILVQIPKLYVLLGNSNHAEAFLELAPELFFDSNILDTVGSKMELLVCNNPLEASTNPVVKGTSTLSTAMGAQEPVEKASCIVS
jgi:hypothetical protein